jgi:hypothetical protein
MLHMHGVEVHRKRSRGGSSEPPEPPICCSLIADHCFLTSGVLNLPSLSRARKVLGWPKRCKLAHALLC